MMMLVACALWVCGGLACLALKARSTATNIVGPASAVLGSAMGLIAVSGSLMGDISAVRIPWQMPFGSIYLSVDALSAVFAIVVLIICALAAVYGRRYLAHHEHPERIGPSWFFFNILTASMFAVVLANNAILFIIAWEIMSLSSFFLVMFDHEKKDVRHAGFIYLVATHVGTFFLLVMFLTLGTSSGSFDFGAFGAATRSAGATGLLFILALIGFGTKAGMMPLHVWLPEAHPAAPSHVSAVMSGVMIKTGIYGILRITTSLGAPPEWWGWTMITIGATSGIMGVLFALAQHDLKRLLAYHSVENIGIICLGMGIGWLGAARGNYTIAALGFAGALLHVANHAVFKSLLFMGAGGVISATGTRDIDHLGGVLKRMPRTGMAFLVGAASICGLPPFNGFVSEFLIYTGSFMAIAAHLAGGAASGGLVVIGVLALIGGLAVACFTKVFGIVFLGEPRSLQATKAREAAPTMVMPMFVLSFLCLMIGFGGSLVVRALSPAIDVVLGGVHAQEIASGIDQASRWLTDIAIGGAVILALTILFAASRRALLKGREVCAVVTWDCGYAQPTARMQYTSSSFAQPITNLFRMMLGTHNRAPALGELFPGETSFSTETPDIWRRGFYDPAFSALAKLFGSFHWLQHGRLNLYILCIVLALLMLLGWKLR